MNANKIIKKNIIFSLGMAAVGFAGLGFYFLKDGGKEMAMFLALGTAFSVLGIVNALIYYFGKNNKRMKDTAIAENDERTVQIRGKASVIALRVLFVALTGTMLFSSFIKIPLNIFISIEMIVMVVVYAVCFSVEVYKN